MSVNGMATPVRDLRPAQGVGQNPAPSQAQNDARSAAQLKDTFSNMFDEVNALQQQADAKIEEFATSPEKDIHGTMIALQKADISLRLMMQIRSKLTAAYQDIMRMQL